jgi:hypothetical protein
MLQGMELEKPVSCEAQNIRSKISLKMTKAPGKLDI